MNVCKKCQHSLPKEAFSQIKRKNSTTYRKSCKSCELKDAQQRRWAKKEKKVFVPISAPSVLTQGAPSNDKTTDPGFFIDDEYAKMPSDSDLLFWSTDSFEIVTESRKILMNKTPKDA